MNGDNTPGAPAKAAGTSTPSPAAAAASSRLPAGGSKPAALAAVTTADADVGLGSLVDGLGGLQSRVAGLKTKVLSAQGKKNGLEQALEAEQAARVASEAEVVRLRKELDMATATIATRDTTIKAQDRELTIFRAATGKSKADADKIREMLAQYEATIAELEAMVNQLSGEGG